MLWVLFAFASFHAWRTTGHPAGLGAVAAESVAVALFIARRPPEWASYAPGDWMATSIGSFGVLAARPLHGGFGASEWVFQSLQLLGAACAVLCLLSLGRSFGLVPANRGVRTRGAYRLVRHPIYSSYLLIDLGYLLENPTVRNGIVFACVLFAQLVRINREETCLTHDRGYAEYRTRVRYRLVPLIY